MAASPAACTVACGVIAEALSARSASTKARHHQSGFNMVPITVPGTGQFKPGVAADIQAHRVVAATLIVTLLPVDGLKV